MGRSGLPISAGDRLGHLVAIRREATNYKGYRCWRFKCTACGHFYILQVSKVFHDENASCGCVRRARLRAERERHPHRRRGRPCVLTAPDGQEHQIQNLQVFCVANRLNAQCLRDVMRGRRGHHKGWTGRYAAETERERRERERELRAREKRRRRRRPKAPLSGTIDRNRTHTRTGEF
jgi:hypothetical protein